MNKTLFFLGLFFSNGCTILLIANYETIDVQRKGKVVKMTIVKLPAHFDERTKAKNYVDFTYEGKEYSKDIGKGFYLSHRVGDLVDVKFLNSSSFVLFPGESAAPNLISFGLLILFGIITAIIYWKKWKRE